MIELLRNCSHGSEIATYIVNREGIDRRIVKAASTSAGIQHLLTEVEGWNWYQGKRYSETTSPLCTIAQQRKSYLKIEITYIEGMKADYNQGLSRNAPIIKKVIEHYCQLWPYDSDGKSPFHGDLSLDNIIYNGDGIHIIDWEHFNEHGVFWGFDALYLLFETLWFGMKRRKKPTKKEIDTVADSVRLLTTHGRLPVESFSHPLRFIYEFIHTNAPLWGEQLSLFPNKLPVILFTDDQISIIDNAIRSRLQETA